jgi:hypothetical protein
METRTAVDVHQTHMPIFHDLDKLKAELTDIQKRLQAMTPYTGWNVNHGAHSGRDFKKEFDLEIENLIQNCGEAIGVIEYFWERSDD